PGGLLDCNQRRFEWDRFEPQEVEGGGRRAEAAETSSARRVTTARRGKTDVTYTKEQENHGHENKGNQCCRGNLRLRPSPLDDYRHPAQSRGVGQDRRLLAGFPVPSRGHAGRQGKSFSAETA